MAAIHILLSAHEWNPYFTAISVFVARKISNQKTMESNLAPKKLENCCRQWLLEEGEEGSWGPICIMKRGKVIGRRRSSRSRGSRAAQAGGDRGRLLGDWEGHTSFRKEGGWAGGRRIVTLPIYGLL